MRAIVRRGMAALALAALALALRAGAARADGEPCIGGDCGGNPGYREFDIQRQTQGKSAGEARRCTGTYTVDLITGGIVADFCARVQAEVDCPPNPRRQAQTPPDR
ncbi:hypothetical protein HRbin22_00002 [Candidatus Thermoflexus japonica]|uniref:Secreted protein n=1 Tax=Candidatus Thermoflexus japonica TaxID=2035417 RepID=A0A2H5Y2X3_9CHLR|nr:hypothetical protein HRbin22_00002 [Candidatus Thermoflexus japonica]